MSEEFRRSLKNRLPPMLPTRAPWADPSATPQEEEEDDDEEELADDVGEMSRRFSVRTDVSPLSASQFFEQALAVTPPGRDATFRVYLTPPTPGAAPSKTNPFGTYVIAHHGAGASGLSFAALAKEIKARAPDLGVLAFDCRGHGKTTVENGSSDTDLSRDTLVADFTALIEHVFPNPKESPSLVLVGHSMGAVPILAATPVLQKNGYNIPGVAVLDVVEGTAVESLPRMKGILGKRPTSFLSVPDAVQWHLASGSVRNAESARVSVPSYVVPIQSGAGPDDKQQWRIDLLKTEPYWAEWYDGLSNLFLTARCARLLVLAGQERLDRELMVGQMQGKFQLEVMQDVGHFLQEDDPATLATTLVAFWKRNTQVLVLPPKIGAPGGLGGPSVSVKHVGER